MAVQALTENKVLSLLDWAYGKIIDGSMPGMTSAESLAQDYLTKHKTVKKSAQALIRMQNGKSMTTGFVTNLGGLLTLPVAMPANISAVLLIQLQMIAALAVMGGYDGYSENSICSFIKIKSENWFYFSSKIWRKRRCQFG